MPRKITIDCTLLFSQVTLSKHDKDFKIYFRDLGGRLRGPFSVKQLIEMIKRERSR